MSTFLLLPLDRCAELLDFIRSRLLRWTMRISWLRPLFYTRALRLAALFSLSFASSLTLSLLFPLWVLLIGPLIYGVPHIFSSLRYFHYAVMEPEPAHSLEAPRTRFLSFGMIFTLLIAVFSWRYFVTLNALGLKTMPQLSEWKGSTYIELGALALTFALGALIYRKNVRRVLLGTLFLLPLFAGFYFMPLTTIGAMVLIHNFVAFFYWIRASKSPSERRVAWLAMGMTFCATVAIFFGTFDFVQHLFPPALSLSIARLTVEDTGRMIAPGSTHPLLWLHACIAFAFGQALHYFVWLKAIPDQYHYHDVPTSFRQSLSLLSRDFGRLVAAALILISVASIVIWSFLSFQEARLVYFCLAAYHGYLEIAGLALSSKAVFIRT